jgi:hypothetical protein
LKPYMRLLLIHSGSFPAVVCALKKLLMRKMVRGAFYKSGDGYGDHRRAARSNTPALVAIQLAMVIVIMVAVSAWTNGKWSDLNSALP